MSEEEENTTSQITDSAIEEQQQQQQEQQQSDPETEPTNHITEDNNNHDDDNTPSTATIVSEDKERKEAEFMVKVDVTDNNLFEGLAFRANSTENQQYIERELLGVLLPSLQQLIERYYDKPESLRTGPNPINYLAMQLMRNHPKHCPRTVGHPYVQHYQQQQQQQEQQ